MLNLKDKPETLIGVSKPGTNAMQPLSAARIFYGRKDIDLPRKKKHRGLNLIS